MSITIDDIPVVNKQTPVKESDIYYASNLAGGSPVENYLNAKQEVAMTGDSTLVNQEKVKWAQEQADRNHTTVSDMISDNTLPIETRRKVMEAYVQGAIPVQDLRDKFMINAAVTDVSRDVEDREAQDATADALYQRDLEKSNAAKQQAIEEGAIKLSDILAGAQKSAATISSGLVLSIPAGLIGVASLLLEQDPDKAAELVKIIQGYAYTPKDENTSDKLSTELTQKISELSETIDVPFKWIGDTVLTLPYAYVENGEVKTVPLGPEFAAAAYTAGEAVGYIGGYNIAKAVLKGKPNVPTGSPMDTIETASKEQASNLTARAMADESGRIATGVGSTKEQLLNTYVLPKVKDEFGPIHPDAREAINAMDKRLYAVAAETELNANVYPVSQILSERELYTKILTEQERPHLLLSSSILDIPAETKLYGRSGKDYEALVDSTATKLEGTAVFGRNANFGYKTEAGAAKYMKKLEESVKHLPDPGKFELLKRNDQFYISWKFTRTYVPHESLAFGDDVLSAHLFSKSIDITDFANGTIGKHIFPAYMRMKEEIPTTGASAAREESRVESTFLREARDTFMKTQHPKELESTLRMGEEQGKSFTAEDIQMQHPHLTKVETDKIHGEYVAYRRIVDHLYNMTDRQFRKNLVDKNMKTLYNNKGEFVGHATEPLKEIPDGVTHVYDLDSKSVVKINKALPVIQMNSPIRVGDHIVNYAHMPSTYQLGPVRAGALTKIPGYIPRSYKEWFVVDRVPNALWVDGKKIATDQLRNYKQAVAMAGTKAELDTLVTRLQKEKPDYKYEARKEEKDINDKIMHDSEVYDTYLKQIHQRGDRLPSLNRPAEVEDVLVALTKTIRSVSKMAAWDDLNRVRRDNFVKAYGDFTDHKFPQQINEIRPKKHMTPKEERDFLAAQSVYAQMEREQISSTQSDIVWRNGWNKVADVVETKMDVDAHILREWGEKGFIPARTIKAFGSNLFLYWRPMRMWVIQPQQWKELVLVSPSYAKHLSEIVPITNGLLTRTHTLKGLKSLSDNIGRKTVQDYDAVIAALEESGIVQSVDMNQMVHGIWKDATKELAPKPEKGVLGSTNKLIESISDAAGVPGKVGRGIGYNPSELLNQVSIWLFARHRWMEKNPGKNWNTPENRATIARDQSLYGHMSSTRAGMYGWQEGMISTFTQFVAIPWKSTLQMISSKQFSGPEKARLAGARLFWYGKYGIPLGYVMYQSMEKNLEEKQDRETLAAWTESATDRIWNATLQAMFDAGNEKTKVDTKNLSTSIDGEYVWDVINTLYEMGKGNTVETPKITFPYENATGSLFEAVRTLYDIFKVNDAGPADMESWKAAAWKSVSFAGTFSDFNKAMLAEGMSKAGNQSGYQQTRGEAVARLFGIPPAEETILNMASLSQIKRRKEIENTAKQIHQRLIAVMNAKSVDEKDEQKEYLDGLQSFLQTVPEYYKDELTKEIFKLDRRSWKDKKESVLLNLYRNGADARDSKYLEMRNALEKSQDPEIKSMLKDLEEIKQRSIK
jgi:hypothetical protein